MNEPDNSLNLAQAAPASDDSKRSKGKMTDGFKNRTRGEGLFNFAAYAGVGYFGVTGFSVFLTWLLRDQKQVSKFYNGLTNKIIEWTKGAREGERLEKYAKTVDSDMTIATLFTGGTIMSVLPIKWLEDNKAKFVNGADNFLYGKEKAESDPTILAAHAELEAAPKQTWMSVFGSRLLAFAATFGTAWVMGSNGSPLAKATGHSIDKHSARAGRWIDGALHHKDRGIVETIDRARKDNPIGINRDGNPLQQWMVNKGQDHAPDRVTSRVWSYITLDGFYTLITGGALYVFTRLLAPIFDRKQDAAPSAGGQVQVHTPAATAQATATARTPQGPAPHVSQAELSGRLSAAPEHAAAL